MKEKDMIKKVNFLLIRYLNIFFSLLMANLFVMVVSTKIYFDAKIYCDAITQQSEQ
jgi:hypothetical protein